MHELSLMEEVRRQALAAAAAADAVRIELICLRVGALAGVDPDALRFAFPLVMAGTIAAAALLQLQIEAAICQCGPCDRPFAVQDGCCDCPSCGQLSRQLLSGRDLRLVALEVS
jgi:hydrogenase nickel incorporation protein HypA/HybF